MMRPWRTILYDYTPMLRLSAAAIAAWECARWMGPKHPYFAPIAVVLTMQTTVEDSIWWGAQRMVGILFGIGMAELSNHVVGIRGWSIGLVILAGFAFSKWFRLGRQAATQVCVSALLVWVVGISNSGYALDRFRDTMVGVFFAVFFQMFILPPDYGPNAKTAIREAALLLANRFAAVGRWINDGAGIDELHGLEEETERCLSLLHKAWKELVHAQHALRFSPLVRGRKTTLVAVERQFTQVKDGYEVLRSMLYTLVSWRETLHGSTASLRPWSDNMAACAHLIERWAKDERSTLGEVFGDERAILPQTIVVTTGDYQSAMTTSLVTFRKVFANRSADDPKLR